MSDEHFFARWSRRKLASKAEPDPTADAISAPAEIQSVPPRVPQPQEPKPPEPLPPVESLTPESDFTPFMRDEVDPGLRQQALRTLFRDPRFNVMDGLDVYIDDFSKPDPIPPDWMEKLQQVARLGDYRPKEESAQPKDRDHEIEPREEKEPAEQKLAAPDSPAPSDTPIAGSPASDVKQS